MISQNETDYKENNYSNFSQKMWLNTYHFLQSHTFRIGWIIINAYSTFYIFYKKSYVNKLITNIYDFFVPLNEVKVYPFKFCLYVKNRKHYRIEPSFKGNLFQYDFGSIIPLKEPPFISVEIMIENNIVPATSGKSNIEVYEIKFRTHKYDYYVEGNEFNKSFIEYFMEKHHRINISNCNYTIHVMRRHDFETIVFTKGDTIVLRNHLKK